MTGGRKPHEKHCARVGSLLSNIAQDLAVEDKTGQPVNDALANEGVVEGENNDDDNWLTEELREQMRADDETDKLSLDTRVNNLILSQHCTASGGSSNHDHNHSRRLAMKKDLHKDFAALCNVHMPSGDYLFGDLSKATKEITDANKLAKRVRAAGSYQTTSRVSRGNFFYGSSNRAQRRYQPYNRNKTPFFEKGRFPTTKKKGTSSK